MSLAPRKQTSYPSANAAASGKASAIPDTRPRASGRARRSGPPALGPPAPAGAAGRQAPGPARPYRPRRAPRARGGRRAGTPTARGRRRAQGQARSRAFAPRPLLLPPRELRLLLLLVLAHLFGALDPDCEERAGGGAERPQGD